MVVMTWKGQQDKHKNKIENEHETKVDVGTMWHHQMRMKLVLAVRVDLKMKRGKIASQCAHAAVSSYKQNLNKGGASQKLALQVWEAQGQPKIVVKIPDENAIREIKELAKLNNVMVTSIRDAGKTQVESGSETVVAVGPASVDKVDKITGKYPLL